MNNQYFTINEVCNLLKISRPTLDSYRKKYGIENITLKGKVYFKKTDIFEQLSFVMVGVMPELDLTVLNDVAVEQLEVAPGVFDLRLIRSIDAFGSICLMCCLKSWIAERKHVYLLTGKSSACFYLKGINFFQELKRVNGEYLHYNSEILRDVSSGNPEIILPLHLIGYKGGEKSILDGIYASLRLQGYSEDMCSSLGWTLGELADNATTHANGPCYFMLSSLVGPRKFLTLTIGDIGLGIPFTLKTNEHYENLDDFKAFMSAFKANVSSWADIYDRGKGLNDLLAIAKGNGAWVRAESNGMGIFFDFSNKADSINVKTAGTKATGTRYSMVLIDAEFDYVTKREMNNILINYLEEL
jgi:hypothetical protein